MKKIIIFTAFSCICLKINAQDVIYTISKDSILAKIIEVNDADIKYKKWGNVEGALYSTSKKNIHKIVYQNGMVENYTNYFKRQKEPNLIKGSRIFLDFILTENEENVNGADAKEMLKEYLKDETSCMVVDSIDEADFLMNLSVIKGFADARKAKITLIYLENKKEVFSTEWVKGFSNAFYRYSGTRHAIARIVKNKLSKKYPAAFYQK